MEPEIRSACWKAAIKLVLGLSSLSVVIGIRIVTAEPLGVASGIADLERLDIKMAAEETAAAASAPDSGSAKGVSIGAWSGSDSRSRDRDVFVSCRLDGSVRFMRSDDCAMRGGESKIVITKP